MGEKLYFSEMFWCEELDRCAIGYMSADVGRLRSFPNSEGLRIQEIQYNGQIKFS